MSEVKGRNTKNVKLQNNDKSDNDSKKPKKYASQFHQNIN